MAIGTKTHFEYHVPEDMATAIELMSTYRSDAKLIAGGTDLIPKVKAAQLDFGHLISLRKVVDLKALFVDGDGALHIGACATLREVERLPGVREGWPALWEAVHGMANTQVRNVGTVVGNICNAVPSADTAPALIAYGASVLIRSASAERTVPIELFFTGVCTTALAPDELAVEIVVPEPAAGAYSTYIKYTVRYALELAMVGVAVNIAMDDGVVKDARIALGAVAAVPKRAGNAEELIVGKELTEALALDAAKAASENDCKPITDIRATAYYRREMVRIHVRDTLRAAAGIRVAGL